MEKSSKKLIPGNRYLFEWNDTYNFLGWHHESEVSEKEVGIFQQTLAFYVKSNKDWHIVAMHWNPNTKLGFPEWGNLAYIPKGSVKRITSR